MGINLYETCIYALRIKEYILRRKDPWFYPRNQTVVNFFSFFFFRNSLVAKITARIYLRLIALSGTYHASSAITTVGKKI